LIPIYLPVLFQHLEQSLAKEALWSQFVCLYWFKALVLTYSFQIQMIFTRQAAAALYLSDNFRSWELSAPLALHAFCKHQSQMPFHLVLVAFMVDS